MTQIGCFEVEQISTYKWKVRNTLTRIEYAMLASSEAEMEQELRRQTPMWEARYDLVAGAAIRRKRVMSGFNKWRPKPKEDET